MFKQSCAWLKGYLDRVNNAFSQGQTRVSWIKSPQYNYQLLTFITDGGKDICEPHLQWLSLFWEPLPESGY